MSNQIKNLLIGLFLVGGIALFVGFIFFLRPSVGDEKQILYVRFSDINKINVGTRVLFAGKAIGEVTEVNEIFHARETQPSDTLGRLYFYQLTLKIDSNVKVFNTDEIQIQTSGLLGEKSISIVPRSPPKGFIPERITEKTPFYAESIDPIENTFSQLSDISHKIEETVDLIKEWLKNNSENLSHAVSSFGSAMDQIEIATKAVNDEALIHQIKLGATSFTASMDKIDAALAQMEEDDVFTNIGVIASNFNSSSSSIKQITQTISEGKGTIGKLIESDDFYLRINGVMSKIDTLMNDMNHYGILFHLNKGWQRQRTKRINILNALETPDSFRTYFQTEVDEINTAMSRISLLIQKAESTTEAEKILDTPMFKKDFAELLRQVNELSDNLRLYNERFSTEP
jgi:phospholipid/cholesterol/gamma-HCH transport system substrate-binding protein